MCCTEVIRGPRSICPHIRLPAAAVAPPAAVAAAPSRVSTVAPVVAAPTAPPASVAVVPSVAPVAIGLGISLALDNVGKACAVKTSVEEASVEETRGVGGGVGVDATVDGARVDSAQAAVEEDLGLGLSLTLAPASTITTAAPRSRVSTATIAAASPAPDR